ncbi:MAG: PadR family transcriptional regulator [Candidatus Korarchaeum sp.]|jgi:DNA-binding PadR family transcriptional regulator|nr:PadR family transcriptional regulator [Candidatus Korarchaeum sp.]
MFHGPPVKGLFRLLVLDAIREEPLHGYEIMRRIGDTLGHPPSPGVVYPTLRSLESEGLVRSGREGRRTVYSITEEGVKYLKENEDRIRCFMERADRIKILKKMVPHDIFPLLEELASKYGRMTEEQRDEVRRAFWRLIQDLSRILGDVR